MKKAILFGLCMTMAVTSTSAPTTLFEQDFSAGTNVSDYNTGGTNKFTGIGVAGGAMGITASIESQQLTFERVSGTNGGYFSKTDGFSEAPTKLVVQFAINLVSNATTQTGASTFFVGSGFANDAGNIIANANVFSKLTIDFGPISGQFRFRDIATGQTTPYFSGTQRITWLLSKDSRDFPYQIPDAGSGTLSPNKWDLWVGTTRVFSDMSAITSTQPLTQFKFTFNGAASAAVSKLTFDDFLMRTIAGILPVTLTHFSTKAQDNQSVLIRWQTANEENSSHFVLRRGQNPSNLSPIARFDAAGTTLNAQQYEYTDTTPLPGINYYQLQQTDHNGTTHSYRPVAVVVEPSFAVFPNPSDGSGWKIQHPNATEITSSLSNLLGIPIPTQQQPLSDYELRLTPTHPLPVGAYLLQVRTKHSVSTRKLWVH